jgi:mRNA interferase MazF
VRRGEVWWASLPEADGSGPGYRRPVLIISADDFNESAIGTVVIAALTSNLRLAAAPGNVRLRRGEAGVPRSSVINVSQLYTIERTRLTARLGSIRGARLANVDFGLRLVLTL